MAWGNKSSAGTRKGVRLTGLFKTKQSDLYVGKLGEKQVTELANLVKLALKEEREIVMFLSTKYKKDRMVGVVSADLSQDQGGTRQPIKQSGGDLEADGGGFGDEAEGEDVSF